MPKTNIKLTTVKVPLADIKNIGPEPEWPDNYQIESSRHSYNTQLLQALNWLNYTVGDSSNRGFLEDYIKIKRPDTAKQDLVLLKKISDRLLNQTFSFLARIAVRGFPLREVDHDKIWQHIETAYSESLSFKVAADTDTPVKLAPVISVFERVQEQVREFYGEVIDAAIDEIATTGTTSIKLSLASRGFGEPHYKRVTEIALGQLAELRTALTVKQDKTLQEEEHVDIREAYEGFSVKTLRAMIAYLDDVCSTAQRLIAEKKAGRTKKKKPVDKNKLVAKFKHLRSHTEFKLNSIDLINCLGATDVWIYNTKTRKLGVYRGEFSNSLSIKNNSWLGYSENISVQKTLRKPQEQLAEFQSLNKNQIKKWFDNIKSVEHRLNGRGNDFTVVLRTA